jgi:P-type Ca2+ transporter type 2C
VFQGLPGRDQLWAIRERHRLRFFDAKEWCIIGAVGVLITLIVTGGYERSLGIGRDVEHARAMALAVLTVASAMLTASLSRLQSGTARVTVAITLAISILLIQTPAFATRLHLVPLHLDDWATAMLGGLLAAALPFFAWDPSPRNRSPCD